MKKRLIFCSIFLSFVCMARVQDNNPELLIAAGQGNEQLVRELLDQGADVNSTNQEGKTALIIAAQLGYKSIVRTLLLYGADPDIAITGEPTYCTEPEFPGDPVMCTDVIPGAPAPFVKHKKWTALDFAVDNGYVEIAELLLKKGGASVGYQDAYGRTALMLASKSGDLSMIRLLLRYGADVNKQSNAGHAALYYAVANPALEEKIIIEIIKLLKNNGATVNDGLLELAEKKKSKNIMKALTDQRRNRSILRLLAA